MKRTQALIHTSIVLFTLTFASSCFMGAFDEPCSSVVDDRARLEAELSESRGERLTFESTNDAELCFLLVYMFITISKM